MCRELYSKTIKNTEFKKVVKKGVEIIGSDNTELLETKLTEVLCVLPGRRILFSY